MIKPLPSDLRSRERGVTKNNIIAILSKEPFKIRFSDLRANLGIAKVTLAQHLDELENEDKIIREKTGKAVYYMLSNKAWDRPDIRIIQFGWQVMSYINNEIAGSSDTKLQGLPEKELLIQLARKITACILFSQIKSVETNQEWYKAAQQVAYEIQALIKRRIIYPEFDYKIWNKPLGQVDKSKLKIERLYKALRELYPEEMKVLEQVYNDPKVLRDPKTGQILVEYKTPPRTISKRRSKR